MATRRKPAKCTTAEAWKMRSWENSKKIVNKFIADFEVVHEYIDIPEGLNPEIAKLLGEISHLNYSFDERAKKLRRAELVKVILEHAESTDAFAKMCKFSNVVDSLLSRIICAQSLRDGTKDGLSEYESEMKDIVKTANLDEKFLEVVEQLK